jgi:L-histidine Nalpha-methyltransferase
MTRELSPGEVAVEVRLTRADLRAALKRDVRAGLGADPKTMPPVWFYDERGCELYDEITKLDEYYLFRTERDLLAGWAEDIAEMAGATVLVELGSRSSENTRLMLGGMEASTAGLEGYVAFDVAEARVREAAATVAGERGIGVHAVVGDFRHRLDAIPEVGAPRLIAFLGSTVGNFTPAERREFLGAVGLALQPDDRFLLATDLVKPLDRLLSAYDDERGVTAEFNRNLLFVLNRELGADFAPERFAHVVAWDDDGCWVEMRLRATEGMVVAVPGVDMIVEFAAGEDVRTEISTKFRPEQVGEELTEAGMVVVDRWIDPAGDYLLTLARPAGD